MLFLLWSDPLFGFKILGHLIFALSCHECAHAWIASLLGDKTAAEQGRITLNPCVQFEWSGLLCFFLFGFGWARPVPFNLDNLKNPQRDEAIIAFAGPAIHIVLALIFTLAFSFFPYEITYIGLRMNVFLAILNLIPLFPLDGEKILAGLTPNWLQNALESIRLVSLLFLLSLLVIGLFIQVDLIGNVINYLVSPIVTILSGV